MARNTPGGPGPRPPQAGAPEVNGRSAPPAPNAAFLLIALGRRTREAVDDRLHEAGLSYRHFSAIGHLQADPGLSYSELGRRAGVTAQSMQSTVAHLEREGLVARDGPGGRGRRAELRVTERGQSLLRAGRAAMTAVADELLAGLAPTKRSSTVDALMRMFLATFDEPAGNPPPK